MSATAQTGTMTAKNENAAARMNPNAEIGTTTSKKDIQGAMSANGHNTGTMRTAKKQTIGPMKKSNHQSAEMKKLIGKKSVPTFHTNGKKLKWLQMRTAGSCDRSQSLHIKKMGIIKARLLALFWVWFLNLKLFTYQ